MDNYWKTRLYDTCTLKKVKIYENFLLNSNKHCFKYGVFLSYLLFPFKNANFCSNDFLFNINYMYISGLIMHASLLNNKTSLKLKKNYSFRTLKRFVS